MICGPNVDIMNQAWWMSNLLEEKRQAHASDKCDIKDNMNDIKDYWVEEAIPLYGCKSKKIIKELCSVHNIIKISNFSFCLI